MPIKTQANTKDQKPSDIIENKPKVELSKLKEASEAEKYQKEKQFVEKIEMESRKSISKMSINYKPIIKKDNIKFKKNKSNNAKVVLPPIDASEET